jgi:2-dehydro-3-deoxyphosphogluconate aldolase/(4S)-4-hydroxy-2-oxoglutarate aldolase
MGETMHNNRVPVERILETGLMVAARLPEAENAVEITEALARGGVRAIEFSMAMPDALDAIAMVAQKRYEHISVGVGTVLDAESAREAIKAGAQFVVSPCISESVAEMSHRYGKPYIPGALTPNEILRGYELGAAIIKVFPGGLFGPEYFRSILAPLEHIPLMPDGAVSLKNARELIAAGAAALGVGGALVSLAAIEVRDFDTLTNLALKFVAEINAGRSVSKTIREPSHAEAAI